MPTLDASRLPLGVTAVMLPELGFEQQLELCASLGLRYYVYRPRHIPDRARGEAYSNWGNHKFDLTPERLLDEGPQLRQQVEQAGLEPFGTVPRLESDAPDEEIRLHVQGARAAGASRVRMNPPRYPGEVFDFEAYLAETVEHYRRAVAIAEPEGVKLTIEMHTGNAAVGAGLAYAVVKEFEPSQVGVILDLPNFAREGGMTPRLAVSVLRPWVDHVHLGGCRRTQGGYDEHGFRQAGQVMCPLTESDVSIPGWLEAVSQLGREVPLIIEDYTANMPGALRLRTTTEAVQRLLSPASVA